MIGRGRHGANAIGAWSEPAGNRGIQTTLAIAVVIDALEEGKGYWIGRRARRDAIAERLDGDMRVADDVAVLQKLGCRVVGGVRIGKGSGFQVEDLEIHGEVGVGGDGGAGRRVGDDGGDHVGSGGDVSHYCGC